LRVDAHGSRAERRRRRRVRRKSRRVRGSRGRERRSIAGCCHGLDDALDGSGHGPGRYEAAVGCGGGVGILGGGQGEESG
jgi:hypothetical protein